MTVCFHLKVRVFPKQSLPELEMISCLSYFSFSLLPGCSRLTSWNIAWTRWKKNVNWRGTSHWNWKTILKTDPKRNRCWSWSGKMRWWRLKSRSYSPSFRYKCRVLHWRKLHTSTYPPCLPRWWNQQPLTAPCLQASPHSPPILSHILHFSQPASQYLNIWRRLGV